MYPEVSRSLFKTDRGKTILQAVLVLSVSLLMMNLNALIDHFLRPEIPYFDHEHLIVGGVTTLLTAVLFGGLTVYMNRLENPLKLQKKAEEALKESENRFKLLAEKSLVGIYLIQDDTFKYVNPRLAEIFGYTVEEIIDKKGSPDIVLQEDLPVVEENIRKRIDGEIEFIHYELRGVKKNKEIINAEVYGSRIMYNGRSAVIGTLLDVTERKQTEEKLRRTTKSLRVLSECNQALLYFSEESDLLKEICRIIVESGGYRLAWVGYAMQDESKRVSPVAQYGFEEGYLETIKVTWADNESGIGPSGTAIRTGKTYIARSIMNDPNFAPWRAEALKRGYNSSVALPLFIEGAVIGALRIYSVDSDAFDSEEIELLTELSLDLSYGIKYIRTTSEHRKAVESLRQSEQRYRDLVENARDVIFTLSADGTITSLNPAFETITGWSRSEWVSKNFVQIIHPDDLPLAMEKFQSVLRGEEPYMFELRSLSRSGKYLVAEFMVTPKVQGGKVMGLLGIARDITERKRTEERLAKINECLLSFAADPIENINCLVSLCGRLLGGACALYNRLDNKMLCSLGVWNVPQDYNPVDAPEGHICYDVIRSGSEDVLVIRNLPETRYAQSDPNVARYKLQTYIGIAVKFGDAHIGSLCVVYQEDFIPSKGDKHILGIIASAIGVEEKRRRSEESLRQSEEKIKKRVKELEEFYGMAVGRELRMMELKDEIERLKEELRKYKDKNS